MSVTILLVEDDPVLLTVLRKSWNSVGMRS